MTENTTANTVRGERHETNLKLLALAHEGDERALEELMRINIGLVNSIAVRFMGRGTELEDLVQIGSMGLLKAIRTFDPSRECSLSTYAVPLIFGEIRRFLRDDGIIKVSRGQKRLGAMLAAERERHMAQTGSDISIAELASRCGVSPEEAASALGASAPVSSLSDLLFSSEDSPTYESTLCDEEETARNLDRIALASAIEKLPDLRKKIVYLRYFRDLSQQKTASILGLTQVKVSREERKIIEFLRGELLVGE